MDKMRLILAVLAAALAMVFAVIWYVKGRQHSFKGRGAALFYATLLIASSIVLVMNSRSFVTSRPDNSPSIQTETLSTPAQIDAPQVQTPTPRLAESAKEPPQPDPAATWTKAAVRTPSAIMAGKASNHRQLIVHSQTALPTSSRSESEAPIEDVIESNILQAFDVIEVFFDTYGTPSTPSISKNSKTAAASIEFVSGSAELSQQSISFLRKLASEFEHRYESGRLEIRAQTNETVSSPSQRLLLTQSRAEAVRNILAAEGFPSDRLVPVGTDKAGETQVKFVHRPN